MDNKIINCPHCDDFIIIEKLNCGIFRHGTYKIDGKQVEPHLCKTSCDELIQSGKIYGCGKPFQIIISDGHVEIKKCDYI